jgi:hypothetical protein
MMSKISLLTARAGGTKDADREDLRRAIAAAAEARQELNNALSARGRCIRFCDEASDRLESATALVTAARDALTRSTVLAATEGTRLETSSELRNARAEQQAAEDAVSASRAAQAALESTLEGPIDALRIAERKVADLARGILSRALEPALADVARLSAALSSARATLWFLHRECHPWPPTPESEQTRIAYTYLPEPKLSLENPAAVAWSAYWSELLKNADAAPPSI